MFIIFKNNEIKNRHLFRYLLQKNKFNNYKIFHMLDLIIIDSYIFGLILLQVLPIYGLVCLFMLILIPAGLFAILWKYKRKHNTI